MFASVPRAHSEEYWLQHWVLDGQLVCLVLLTEVMFVTGYRLLTGFSVQCAFVYKPMSEAHSPEQLLSPPTATSVKDSCGVRIRSELVTRQASLEAQIWDTKAAKFGVWLQIRA